MSLSKRPSLPLDLVEEILWRVPIQFWARFRTICKQWCTLFDHKRFIYKRLDLAKEKGFIQVDHRSVQLFKVDPEALLRLPIPEELHNQIFTQTIHCDGLLLVILYGFNCRKFAVWNPFLSRVKVIEPSSSYTTDEIYGFGYDNVSRDNYKILRIKTPNHNKGRSSGIEIYEFKSKLWRSVDATPECYLLWWKKISMNGNMYWIARAKMANSKIEIFIQSFDFSTETFKPICCVPYGAGSYYEDYYRKKKKDYYHMILSGFGGDRLSLLHQSKNMKIGVWITNKVTDGIVSWSKLFNVDSPHLDILHSTLGSFPAYYIHKTNKIMLWCEESDSKHNYGNVYEMGEGEINKLVVMRSRDRPFSYFHSFCHVYVPSLVPVPE